jgi:dTMP kinase
LKGKFITLEGIDGSGKTTQLVRLASRLEEAGFDVVTTREPGGTPLGQKLRAAFLETRDAVSPRAELLLFAADRAQHVDHLIRPALDQGRIVISDRYADATAAYQGAGRGFDAAAVNEVIRLATGGLKPDLTLFFDIPVELALKRMRGRSGNGEAANRMDSESVEFYERVRTAYLEIAASEPQRFRVIDASRTVEEIQREAYAAVEEALC